MTGQVARRLACNLGRRDEEPNILLARALAIENDAGGIAELADLLEAGSSSEKNDAVKVLYEIGSLAPSLIVPHANLLHRLLKSKANRLVWGALTAFAEIARIEPEVVFAHLADILKAGDAGSVIAKDQVVQILIALKQHPAMAEEATAHLFKRLEIAATNQLPMYAERIAGVLQARDLPRFREILSIRLQETMPDSKRMRLEKVVSKLP